MGALRGARSSGLVRTWGDFPRHPGYRCASRSQQGSLADPIEGLVPFPCAGLRQRLIHTVATCWSRKARAGGGEGSSGTGAGIEGRWDMRYRSRPRATSAAGGGGRCLRCLGAGAGGRKFVKRQRQGKYATVDCKCGVDRWVGRRGLQPDKGAPEPKGARCIQLRGQEPS